MSSVILSNRTNDTPTRIKIEGLDFEGLVDDLKLKAAAAVDVPLDELELIYRGECLKEGTRIAAYGIVPNVVVHALRRRLSLDGVKVKPEETSLSFIKDVVAVLSNPAYRNTLEQILAKPETLESLIAASPDLHDDPVAMAILQTPELLLMLADSNKIESVINDYPCLGPVAVVLAGYISDAPKSGGGASGGGASGSTGRAAYSLDQMSDDEDYEPRRGTNEAITASQLAAALMTAAPTATSSAPSTSITNDFFREAMRQASGSQPPAQQAAVTEAALQQIRDMGITDESLARRALTATNGDIQGALELIFGEGTF